MCIPIQREIAQQWRGRAGNKIADQLRRKETRRDAVAAIAISRVDALGAGNGTDQRQPVARGVEGAGPTEIDVGVGDRPERRKLLRQQARFSGDQIVPLLGQLRIPNSSRS